MKNKKLGKDFTEGNIVNQLFRFLTPFLLANILNSLYNTVDMMIIGQFAGSIGIVAISQGGKMLNIFTHISMALSSAGQIIIGQQIGAKRHHEISETIGTLFSTLIFLSIILSIFCTIFAPQIINLLQTPVESYDSAVTYLRLTSSGFIFLFGYTSVSAILRGMGESKMPLIFIGIATVLNIIFDFVFIKYYNLGAAGAALATLIGQGASLTFSIFYLYNHREHFDFDFKLNSFSIKLDKLKLLLKFGMPRATSAFMIQGTQLVMIAFVNQYGLVQAAVYSIGDKITFLTNIISQAIRQASSTMVAQNLGAEKYNRVTIIVKWSVAITMSFAIILAIPSILFPNFIFSLFTSDTNAFIYSKQIMTITAITYFLAALSGSLNSVTSGSGNAKLDFLAGFIDGVVLRLGLGMLFGLYFGMEAIGFYLGHSLARLAGVTIHGFYFQSGKWKYRSLLNLKDA